MYGDDIRIGVINDGPFEPTWFWDAAHTKRGFTYKVSDPKGKRKVTYVPLEVAREHWAIKVEGDKVVRDMDPSYDEGDSIFDSKLGSHCPKKNFNPSPGQNGWYPNMPFDFRDDPAFVDWYTNRVHFVLKRAPQVMTIEE